MGRWTFARRMGVAFAVVLLVAAAIAASTVLALRALADGASEARVLRQGLRLAEVERLRRAFSETVAGQRGHALTGDPSFLAEADLARRQFLDTLADLRARPATPLEADALRTVALAEEEHQRAVPRRGGDGAPAPVAPSPRLTESRALTQRSLERLVWLTRFRLDEDAGQARRVRARGSVFVLAAAVLGLLVTAGLVALLTRVGPLRREARSSRTRFRLLVDGMKDYALYLLDAQGRVASWNAGAERLQGWSAEDIIGRPDTLLYPPEDARLPGLNRERAAREERLEVECVRLHREGTRFWAESLFSALRDPGGRLEGFTVLTRDITERRRQEGTQRLFAEVGRLFLSSQEPDAAVAALPRLLVPSLADGCLLGRVAPRGEPPPSWVVHVSADKQALLEELSRLPGPPPRESAWLREVLRSGRSELFTELTPALLRRLADSPEHLALLERLGACSALTVPLCASGQTLGVLVLVSQRPERRFTLADQIVVEELASRAALALENARLLREAQAALELIGVAAHDLGNPLQTLQLLIGKLRRSLAARPGPDVLDEGLARALRHTQRLGRLLHNLLDFSRLSAGQLRLELGDVDLAELVVEAAARHAEQSEEAGSPLILHLEPAAGHWDRLLLERVLTNLLSNAFKYGKGQPIELRVRALPEGVRLIVRDHGPGIPAEQQRAIFERFTKAPPRGETKEGFGLGLYIVRQLVEAHGGRIQVESVPGEGATFSVELPWTGMRREVDAIPAPPGGLH